MNALILHDLPAEFIDDTVIPFLEDTMLDSKPIKGIKETFTDSQLKAVIDFAISLLK